MIDRQDGTTAITEPPVGQTARIRCRPIGADDVEPLIALLVEGFPARKEAVWRRGLSFYLARFSNGTIPPSLGFFLEVDERPVGVLLRFENAGAGTGPEGAICNLSNRYVRPAFRLYAALLDHVAQRDRGTTYLNISAIRSNWAGHEARGFRRLSTGQVVALPLLACPRGAVRAKAHGDHPVPTGISPSEIRLMAGHMDYGCVSVIATGDRGSAAFVFKPRPPESLRVRFGLSLLSYFQPVYCRTTDDLARFSPAIGRYLLQAHRVLWPVLDADGPMPGWFVPRRGTKFARGPVPIRKGDLSYTELAFFHD